MSVEKGPDVGSCSWVLHRVFHVFISWRRSIRAISSLAPPAQFNYGCLFFSSHWGKEKSIQEPTSSAVSCPRRRVYTSAFLQTLPFPTVSSAALTPTHSHLSNHYRSPLFHHHHNANNAIVPKKKKLLFSLSPLPQFHLHLTVRLQPAYPSQLITIVPTPPPPPKNNTSPP